MATPISMSIITAGVESALNTLFPGMNVYTNPNQQTPQYPCFFITPTPVKLTVRLNRYQREIAYTVAYAVPLNLVNSTDALDAVQDVLDANLEYIPIADGMMIHTYDRQGKKVRGMLNYTFTVKPWMYLAPPTNPSPLTLPVSLQFTPESS